MHSIRLAQKKDAPGVLEIYRPFIENTTVSYEYEVPSIEEMAQRIENSRPRYPWLVSEFEGIITGYAYGGLHRKRQAYQWTTEVSVYVHPDFRKKGIATALYKALFDTLKLQGFVNVYAGIATPNPASIAFHESMGFEFFARYDNVGFKFGAFQTTEWYRICLWEQLTSPSKLKTIEEIEETEALLKIVESAKKLIRI